MATEGTSAHAREMTVNVVCIARDEESSIGRMLASVRHWVDALIVVDTGSRDGTPAAASESGAQVHAFEWSDDFSAARNFALSVSDADWNLVLDADEWLLGGGEWLLELRSIKPTFVGAISLEDRFRCGTDQVARTSISRLLPREVRYQGRVHEQPKHALKVVPVPLRIAHDGYQPQALERKRGRNRHLLMKAIAESPHDPYLYYQLGKDASVYDEHELAESWLKRAHELAGPDAPWKMDLLLRRIYALKQLGRHHAAAALLLSADAEGEHGGASPDIPFAQGDLMMDWAAADPGRAHAHLLKARSAFTRCLQIGERTRVSGSVAGRGSHLAAHNLALVCEVLGDGKEAMRLRRQFDLDSPSLLT